METLLATDTALVVQDPTSNSGQPQSWVGELVSNHFEEDLGRSSWLDLRRRVGSEFTVVSARLENARSLNAGDFGQGVEATYQAVFDAVDSRKLVRVWNQIPGILDPLGDVDQRYKVFNAARFRSYSGRFDGKGNFGKMIPTASGIGTDGDDFLVHALATKNPATPVENPRQIPSYDYSIEYGPLPPCFARAVRVECASTNTVRLFVGGTASIRGEKTYFEDSLGLQFRETVENLTAVVASGLGRDGGPTDSVDLRESLLARYRHLRAYCPRREDLVDVANRVRAEFKNLEGLDLVQADLCRDGLMVEIEGWADVRP